MEYVVTRYQLYNERITCGQLKIAVIADLHDQDITWLTGALTNEKPDLILIPGDICSGHFTEIERPDEWTIEGYDSHPRNAIALLKYCGEIAPTFISRGNHEWRFDQTDIDFVNALGAHWLENEYQLITLEKDGASQQLAIGGLASPVRYGRDFKEAADARPELGWLVGLESAKSEMMEPLRILLNHHPEYYDEFLADRDLDLIVSGHVHGGQWRFFGRGIFAPGQGLFPKYHHGLYGNMVVSSGLSNTAMDGKIPRWGNPKELVTITIHS